MKKPPSIDPLAKFSVAPMTAGKMSDLYAKALGGAVQTPDENQRLIRTATKTTSPVKGLGAGLKGALASIKKTGTVKVHKGGI